ncbi:hypothetical protein K7432_011935 [Basidiobolus ranarum]|uniref:Uncharacterized protein n=1 Tax=Basidiobolus ranarum TaxID=34480 RepID=A0ABR2VT26_9FUNG
MTFMGYSLLFCGVLATMAYGDYCGPLRNSSNICQEVAYSTTVDNIVAAEANVKELLNKISREGYENAGAGCFLAIREALCAITYRKCDPDTLKVYPVCPLVRDRAISICEGGLVHLDKFILEDNIDSKALQNSSDCYVYSSQSLPDGKNESIVLVTSTYNLNQQTLKSSLYTTTSTLLVVATSIPNNVEAPGTTTTATVTVALSTKEPSSTLVSHGNTPDNSNPNYIQEDLSNKSDLEAVTKAVGTKSSPSTDKHSPVLILRPNLEANETSSNTQNEELQDRFNISLVFTFVSVTLIGGLISVGTGLLLWKLRRRKNLRYDQVWEADEEPETKKHETQYLTTPNLSSTDQTRMSHEVFVLEDSEGSDMEA